MPLDAQMERLRQVRKQIRRNERQQRRVLMRQVEIVSVEQWVRWLWRQMNQNERS